MIIRKNEHEIRTVDEWFEHAPPRGLRLHWRDGRSAKELAKAWCGDTESPVVPAEFAALFGGRPELANLVLESGEPEARIPFDAAAGEPRNADLVLIGSCAGQRIAINVEAKADESFGLLMIDELSSAVHRVAQDEPRGKLDRLLFLADAILSHRRGGQAYMGQLRYQLLTGLAGTLAYAAAQECPIAVFVVHEFVGPHTRSARLADNARDLNDFVGRLTGGEFEAIVPGELIGPVDVHGNPWGASPNKLYVGKARRSLMPVPEADPDLFGP